MAHSSSERAPGALPAAIGLHRPRNHPMEKQVIPLWDSPENKTETAIIGGLCFVSQKTWELLKAPSSDPLERSFGEPPRYPLS